MTNETTAALKGVGHEWTAKQYRVSVAVALIGRGLAADDAFERAESRGDDVRAGRRNGDPPGAVAARLVGPPCRRCNAPTDSPVGVCDWCLRDAAAFDNAVFALDNREPEEE